MEAQHDVVDFLEQLSLMPDGGKFVNSRTNGPPVDFDFGRPLHVGRAPGRLDVMGSIADYSGSLVLQMPIAEACIVALQFHPLHEDAEQNRINACSLDVDAEACFEMPTSELWNGGVGSAPDVANATSLESLRAYFAAEDKKGQSWAAYVVGVLGVLAHEPETQSALRGVGGCSILVSSKVPEGKGVSSSAAVEVATMMAALGALGVTLHPPERVAMLCQRVENFVVGAPCGIMDQMASALGRKSTLLPLLCQPHTVDGSTEIPSHLRVWGIDSGVRHSVGGSDYGTVRTATFMAKTVLRELLKARKAEAAQEAASSSDGVASALELPENVSALDHLVDLSPSLFAELSSHVPETMSGAGFLERYGSHGDAATVVDPGTTYNLRCCAAHPIHEHFRVGAFRQLLALPASEAQRVALGELMYQSHASYNSVALGSEATDRIVMLVRGLGPASGLYGAKITGGGSGGTVCVLGANTKTAERSFELVLERYRALSGHSPYIVSGSSLGAVAFGSFEVSQHKTAADAYKAACADGGQAAPKGGAAASKGSKRRR